MMLTEDEQKYMDILSDVKNIARQSGGIVKDIYTKGDVKIIAKQDLSPLTIADIESQKFIIHSLNEKYPKIQSISEEQTIIANKQVVDGLYFVVDPIDGTSNFACHIPFFSISIALYLGNTPILGVLFDPMNNEMFSAIVGNGAYINDKRIKTTEYNPFEQSFINLNVAKLDLELVNQINALVAKKTKKVRNLGCVSLEMAWVACGKIDGLINHYLSIWDIGASGIILEEAVGVWSTLDGHKPSFPSLVKFPICAARTTRLHKELLERIGEIRTK